MPTDLLPVPLYVNGRAPPPAPHADADADADTAAANHAGAEPVGELDRLLQAAAGQASGAISPISLALAYADWSLHLAASPAKMHSLLQNALQQQLRLAAYVACAGRTGDACGGQAAPPGPPSPCIVALPQDQRFRHPAWQTWPYNAIHQGFLLQQQWWHRATTGVGGVSARHERVVNFLARQCLDMVSPGNFIATNPQVQQAAREEQGQNFVRGAINLLNDLDARARRVPPPGSAEYQPGKQVALTRGAVVLRNHLIELIQYRPVRDTVHPQPLLIVPAWIGKYYLLDLSRHNSLVSYLVNQGHTVFMVSWRNPGKEDRELGLDDYLSLGLAAACAAVSAIVPGQKINAVGHYLGGTLLAAAAASRRPYHAPQFNSLTLLAAQTDFSVPGELALFIDESQVSYLENLMARQGFLDSRQMAGAFDLQRSSDLLLSRLVHDYLLGRSPPSSDLAAWHADNTRLPARMHGQYLRSLMLENALYAGRFRVRGQSVALGDLAVPIFAVGTEADHVAPWASVYRLRQLTGTPFSFVLADGGHHAGILSPPGQPGGRYRIGHMAPGAPYAEPARWRAGHQLRDGSWWPDWAGWLAERSGAPLAEPPAMGAPERGYPPLEPAPGSYVRQQ